MMKSDEYPEANLNADFGTEITGNNDPQKNRIDNSLKPLKGEELLSDISENDSEDFNWMWDPFDYEEETKKEIKEDTKPAENEQIVRDIDQELDCIEKLELYEYSYWGGRKLNIYSCEGNRVIETVEKESSESSEDNPHLCEFTRDELITFLKSLHIGEWKQYYSNIEVLDGIEWQITFFFSNGNDPIARGGYARFPDNYHLLRDYLNHNSKQKTDNYSSEQND